MLTSKFGIWVSVALAGLTHAHIGPYNAAMYAINGTDPSNPSLYTGISSNPLWMLNYEDYWLHGRYGSLNFPPPAEDAIEIVPGGTITLELAENARFTTLSPNPILSDWGDGQQHPEDYSITNLGGSTISPSGCISAPNLHTQNETEAAGTALAISYESDPRKVTPNNTVVISVLQHTPWKRIATYQIPDCLPPSDGLVHLVWSWYPRHCGQANGYYWPLLAKVVQGPKTPQAIGIPAPPVYCGLDGSNPSVCVKGPKQLVIVQQAEGNNVIGADVLDPDGLWAAPGYNPSCGWANGPQNDVCVDPGSPNALYPPAGSNQTLISSPSTGAVSATTPGDLTSSLPLSTASATPATTLAESGTPTLSTPQGTCTAGGHKRRMRREKHNNVF